MRSVLERCRQALWRSLVRGQPNRRLIWCLWLLIVALAAGLRFYRIDRLPPGLHYDEAFNNLQALRMVRDGRIPVFIAEEFGALPMHHWLIALLFCFTGPIVLGGRLVSAMAGVLTVGLLAWSVREMFYQELGERQATALGLLAALSLALLHWHAHYSRIGMEPNVMPLFIVATFGCTWRTLRRRSLGSATLAGVLLGCTVYTYPPAYFVPAVMALFFGLWVFARREFRQAQWRTLLVVAGVAALVVAPLGRFAVAHPASFFMRSGQLVQSAHSTWWAELGKVAAGIFVQGDLNVRQNLPGRPMLDPIQATLFILGVGVCAVRRRPAYLFLVTWCVLLLLPTGLTALAPHFGRALGAAPAMATLVGLGGLGLYEWATRLSSLKSAEGAQPSPGPLARRWNPRYRNSAKGATALVLCAALALSGMWAVRDYFAVWGRSADLFIAFDVGLRRIGEYVASLPEGERVYLSPVYRDYPTLRFLLNDRPERIHSFEGRRCFVYPARTEHPVKHIVIVAKDDDRYSLPRLRAAFPAGRVVEELSSPLDDTPYLVVYQTPAGQAAQTGPAHSLTADFDGRIRLLGYDPPRGPVAPGDTLRLRLYWQSTAPLEQWYKVFLHLWGTPSPLEGGRIWGQQDVQPCFNSYPFPRWIPGDIVADEYHIPVSADAPAGEYQVAVGLYTENGPRLAVLDATGAAVRTYVVLTTVQVAAP